MRSRSARSESVVWLRSGAAACFCALIAAALIVSCGCVDQPPAAFARLFEANRLSADLLVQFTKASDAANRAVMADTDEASTEFAREADHTAAAVEDDVSHLAPVLEALHFSDESKLLKEFQQAFAKYRTLDREILELAVVNTNLKAQRLSFGPAADAAEAFRAALEPATLGASTNNGWHARALATQAVLSVREIQVLQAPHIAETQDPVMDAFEKRMAASAEAARAALKELGSLGRPELDAAIAAADAALARFMDVNAQLVALSRRNSNVRSLALSLGQKRTLTAACEASLRALGDHLAQRKFAGTR